MVELNFFKIFFCQLVYSFTCEVKLKFQVMPRRKRGVVVRRRARRMRGRGFLSFAKKVGKWLKKTKLLSRGASVLSDSGVPYVGAAGKIAGIAGFGRKRRCVTRCRRRKGAGLRLAGVSKGYGISTAGGARYGRKKTYGRGRTVPLPIAY